jgi:cell wall-associated NlpC family hydrolase
MSDLDKRLHVYRDDLADVRLQGKVQAARFVEGVAAQCIAAVAPVHKTASDSAMQLTQVLHGETLKVFERSAGWAWVQLDDDRYVGYVREDALSADVVKTTHRVSALLSHLYPEASIKAQPAPMLSLNAKLAVESVEGEFLKLRDGRFVYASHVGAVENNFVTVAERFLHVPYLWGGISALGIDCSGLVQMSLKACGVAAPRDSDMQEKDLGIAVAKTDLRRGDLVFWKGHVGIMEDADTLLHANGHHMLVVREPLDVAVKRIVAKGSEITSVKRL